MKVRITPAIQSEIEGAIEDALRRERSRDLDASDGVYLKIHAAMAASKGIKAVVIEADSADVAELRSRAENEVGRGGICPENIADCHDFSERAYWMGRQRAYRALLKQLDPTANHNNNRY